MEQVIETIILPTNNVAPFSKGAIIVPLIISTNPVPSTETLLNEAQHFSYFSSALNFKLIK